MTHRDLVQEGMTEQLDLWEPNRLTVAKLGKVMAVWRPNQQACAQLGKMMDL
jgi:hypothetical protein